VPALQWTASALSQHACCDRRCVTDSIHCQYPQRTLQVSTLCLSGRGTSDNTLSHATTEVHARVAAYRHGATIVSYHLRWSESFTGADFNVRLQKKGPHYILYAVQAHLHPDAHKLEAWLCKVDSALREAAKCDLPAKVVSDEDADDTVICTNGCLELVPWSGAAEKYHLSCCACLPCGGVTSACLSTPCCSCFTDNADVTLDGDRYRLAGFSQISVAVMC
jgi:hypothetical protein